MDPSVKEPGRCIQHRSSAFVACRSEFAHFAGPVGGHCPCDISSVVMPHDRLSRRHFFFGSLLAGAVPAAGFGSSPSLKALGYKSPNEKLNIASIGAGGKAESDIMGCASENIVALCDVDSKRAARMFKTYENVPKYTDFRKMLDKENKNIDAVIIAIPDHMHATAASWSMERGKHVFCQKPLTRTIWEARSLAESA